MCITEHVCIHPPDPASSLDEIGGGERNQFPPDRTYYVKLPLLCKNQTQQQQATAYQSESVTLYSHTVDSLSLSFNCLDLIQYPVIFIPLHRHTRFHSNHIHYSTSTSYTTTPFGCLFCLLFDHLSWPSIHTTNPNHHFNTRNLIIKQHATPL
jgi:hypothetical protein